MNSPVFVLSSLLMSQGRGQGTEGLCCLVTGDLIFAALSSQTHYPVSNDVPMKVLLDPFCIHFFTHWYPIALFLNKRSISRSLASAFIMHATESYSFCLCGRGNKSKDALLFTDLFWFFNYCHSSLLLDGLSLHFSQGIFFLFLSVHVTFFFALFWVADCVVLCPIMTLSLSA